MRFSFSSRGKSRESFEGVRREYLAARTRIARTFIAGLPLVPALFATRSRAGLRSGEASFAVPENLRAAGTWALRVSGKTTAGFFRPNVETDFPVSV